MTYLPTTGGLNAGIVSEPNYGRRSYRITSTPGDALHIDPDTWLTSTPHKSGSWWPEWSASLPARSGAEVAPPAFPPADGPLPLAPGHYVLQS